MHNNFDIVTISEILSCPDAECNKDLDIRIFGLPLALGENAENDKEYEYAFETLKSLSMRKNSLVRANSILGFAYLARTNGRLNKKIILQIIKNEWKNNIENRGKIENAIEDINQYLGWNLNTRVW